MAADMGSTVLGIIIFLLALGGIFIVLRVYTRIFIKKGAIWWDDALIVITWFIILAYNTCMFVSVSHGYGKHEHDLSTHEYIEVVHAEVIGQACAIASFPTGKASVAVCLMRIFPGKKLRWLLWGIIAANTIVFYLDAILILVQCNPVSKQWNFSEPGSCWDPSILANYGIFTGAVGCASDFALAAIPWFYIAKLRMRQREKVAVGIALSVGFLAGIFSILKIYYTTTLNARADYAYDTIPLVLWSCGELCAINIAACIPTLRPLLQKISPSTGFSGNRSKRSADQQYHYKSHNGHFNYVEGAASSMASKKSERPPPRGEQILLESTFDVENSSAHGELPSVDEQEATSRF